MKKIISVLLILVMCLGLVACSGSSGTPDFLYQEWRRTRDGKRLSFEKDGNCVLGEKEFKYEYNEKLGVISIYTSATMNLTVVQDGDHYKLEGAGTFVPVEEFRNKYIDEAVSHVAGTAEEIFEGNTYTLEDGVTFTLKEAKLIEKETEYFWSLSFSSDAKLVIRDAYYGSPSETGGYPVFEFSLEESSDGNSLNFSTNRGISKKNTQEDAKDYGVLVLTIGIGDSFDGDSFVYGLRYYVSLDTFFN